MSKLTIDNYDQVRFNGQFLNNRSTTEKFATVYADMVAGGVERVEFVSAMARIGLRAEFDGDTITAVRNNRALPWGNDWN